ncbi:MAG: HDIG domain-containing protein, partial [Holophagales bacterium]|nr:HDIG domain-containing protein [Holophagales bacterium]
MAQTRSSNGGSPTRRGTRSAILRRPPKGGLPLFRHRLRQGWFQLLEQPWVWISLFVVIATWMLLPQRLFFVPELQAGEIAGHTWIADRDIQVRDEAATEQLRARAAQEVLPIYDRDRSVQAETRARLAALFASGRSLFGEEGELGASDAPSLEELTADEARLQDLLARLGEGSTSRLRPEALGVLLRDGFSTRMEDRLSGLIARISRQGVVADKELLLEHRVRGIVVRDLPSGREAKELDLFRFLDYPEQVQEEVDNDLRGWDGSSSADRRILAGLVLDHLSPNLNYNSSDTLSRRRAAADAEGTVTHTFGKGEVIVRRGARVDELRARALVQLAGERNLGVLTVSAVGTLLLLGAGALLIWLAVGQERRRDRGRDRMLGEALILLTLAVVAVRLGSFLAGAVASAVEREPLVDPSSYRLAIPFAAVALSAVLLYGRNLALVVSLVFALLAGRLTGGDAMWEVSVYVLASCLAAVFALDQAQLEQRSLMTRAALVVGSVNALAVLTLESMGGAREGGATQLGFDLLCGFGGGLLAAAVTSFAVPILEPLFDITTSIKLIELANPNLPLLRRLAFEAPGTFQHSLAVANLAKAGVEAIDGDSVLVHTGALYHDIGKTFRPHYFIENQPPGQNPHDKIQPSMSALILINHVKEGLELAEKHLLPTPIIDAIEQHHGTRLIKYFYNRAKER